MTTKDALKFASIIQYFYVSELSKTEGIQTAIGDNLSVEEYNKFCDSMRKKRKINVPDDRLKNFSKDFKKNPVNVDDILSDGVIVENWSFQHIIESVSDAIET